MTSAMGVARVDYIGSAKRHFADAATLLGLGRRSNAGQLLGFAVECGLKGMLVAFNVPADADGGIAQGHRLRQHMPVLGDRLVSEGHLVPDGRFASDYLAKLGGLSGMKDWSVDHRYWNEAALPVASLSAWQSAAADVMGLLDQAKEDGVL